MADEQRATPAGRPDLAEWSSRFEAGQAQRFGVRVRTVEPGFAAITLERPHGDERDRDPLFLSAGLHYAADTAALAAVLAKVDPEREQPNGTASLHLNALASSQGALRVEARVAYWATYEALLEISATDGAGQLVARGLSAYSLRPKQESPQLEAAS